MKDIFHFGNREGKKREKLNYSKKMVNRKVPLDFYIYIYTKIYNEK